MSRDTLSGKKTALFGAWFLVCATTATLGLTIVSTTLSRDSARRAAAAEHRAASAEERAMSAESRLAHVEAQQRSDEIDVNRLSKLLLATVAGQDEPALTDGDASTAAATSLPPNKHETTDRTAR